MSHYFASAFRRRPNDGWFRSGRYDVTTVDLICGVAVLTMFIYGLFGRAGWSNLVFGPNPVRTDLDIWRIVTWSTATQPDFWPLLGIFFFWMIGQDVESMMGRNRFLTWFVVLTVVPAVIMTLLGALSTTLDSTTIASGLQLTFLGAIWVYAATYPQVRWFEIVPLWGIAVAFTLLNLLRYNGDGLRGMVLFTLVSVGVALVAGRSLGVAAGWPIPHVNLPVGGGSHSPRRDHRPRRKNPASAKRTVVEGPWGAPTPTRPSPDAAAAQAELDLLLDKISSGGLESLTADEKRRLNELSKRLR